MQRALSEARHVQGKAIFLVGEEGIGKSRLVAEAIRLARADGMCVMRGRGSEVGPEIPFRPLSEALFCLLRAGVRPAGATPGSYLGILGRRVPGFASGHEPVLAPSLVDLAEAVLQMIAAASSNRGCLLVLEDLHGVATETLAVVEYLVDNIDMQRTVVLATLRAGLGPAFDLARAAVMRGSGSLITLGRLAKDEVGTLVAACLGVRPQDVPRKALERLWQDSAGNPAVVQELLQAMVSARLLVSSPDGVRLVGDIQSQVPSVLAQKVARRADKLGSQGRNVLTAAAVIGRKFPLAVVQAVTGIVDDDLQAVLTGAIGDGLVEACDQDWYRFTHPLTVAALVRQLTPAGRVSIARRAAEVIESDQAVLDGRWSRVATMLRLQAGDRIGAARVLAAVGSKALADGNVGQAAALLSRAWKLLDGTGVGSSSRADILGELLTALGEVGQVSQARRLGAQLDELDGLGLRSTRLAALHARAGLVIAGAGHLAEAAAHADVASSLLAGPTRADGGLVTALRAFVAAQSPGGQQEAQRLARLAIDGGDLRPDVLCQLWEVIGLIARRRDVGEATMCFERCYDVAVRHGLSIWKTRAQTQLAVCDCVTGSLAGREDGRIRSARRAAARFGAIPAGCDIDTAAALMHVLRGEYEQAGRLIERCWAEANRLALTTQAMAVAMVRSVLAAHQARRPPMDAAMAEFWRLGGHASHLSSLPLGLARVFCAILDDDLELARRDLAVAVARDAAAPATYPLAGTHGLHPLLQVLAGEAGWPEYEAAAAAPASALRWNLQFVLLTRAVLLGREGRKGEAMDAMSQAEQAAAPFVLAHHVGLRLVAQAACVDGWGEPAQWLRRAEDHFHRMELTSAAQGCRVLLRQIGAAVPQRRQHLSRVPETLRRLGVTVREYDVLVLLASRLGNKAIADALFISPRTAEKHVASLLLKTGLGNRAKLSEFAATRCAQTP